MMLNWTNIKTFLVKRVKSQIEIKTQDSLIREALELEEQNIKKLKEFLTLEEQRRNKVRVVRPQIDGPFLRWVSRVQATGPSRLLHSSGELSLAMTRLHETPGNYPTEKEATSIEALLSTTQQLPRKGATSSDLERHASSGNSSRQYSCKTTMNSLSLFNLLIP